MDFRRHYLLDATRSLCQQDYRPNNECSEYQFIDKLLCSCNDSILASIKALLLKFTFTYLFNERPPTSWQTIQGRYTFV
jgi:hypothetical protein